VRRQRLRIYGGAIAFDVTGGLLYAVGQGSPVNDVSEPETAFGKVLRFEVAADASTISAHPQNPFFTSSNTLVGKARYLRGTRSVNSLAVDLAADGDIYFIDSQGRLGDEVNMAPAEVLGTEDADFGWPSVQGLTPQALAQPEGLIAPLALFSRARTRATVGGLVYRGSTFAADGLAGGYIYSDGEAGGLFFLPKEAQVAEEPVMALNAAEQPMISVNFGISAVGAGFDNEIVLVSTNGSIYTLVGLTTTTTTTTVPIKELGNYNFTEDGWTIFAGGEYLPDVTRLSVADARARCLSQGADLLAIESAEEQAFVGPWLDFISPALVVWTGGRLLAGAAGDVPTLTWSSDGRATFGLDVSGGVPPWQPNEPNDIGFAAEETCVAFRIRDNTFVARADWLDIPCNALRQFVCERRTVTVTTASTTTQPKLPVLEAVATVGVIWGKGGWDGVARSRG
jgi:hypothetical protein